MFIYSSHGRRIDPMERLPNYQEIYHSLGSIRRFSGHGPSWVRWFVLQHSVAVALLAARDGNPQRFVEGLFHDAAEIFTGDIPSPFKPPAIRALEESFHVAWGEKLVSSIPWLEGYEPEHVKAEDAIMLSVEAEFYMRLSPEDVHRDFPSISEADRRDGARLYHGLVAVDPVTLCHALNGVLSSSDPIPEIRRVGRLATSSLPSSFPS